MQIGKLEEVVFNYMAENDLKISKTEFPDERRYVTK